MAPATELGADNAIDSFTLFAYIRNVIENYENSIETSVPNPFANAKTIEEIHDDPNKQYPYARHTIRPLRQTFSIGSATWNQRQDGLHMPENVATAARLAQYRETRVQRQVVKRELLVQYTAQKRPGRVNPNNTRHSRTAVLVHTDKHLRALRYVQTRRDTVRKHRTTLSYRNELLYFIFVHYIIYTIGYNAILRIHHYPGKRAVAIQTKEGPQYYALLEDVAPRFWRKLGQRYAFESTAPMG